MGTFFHVPVDVLAQPADGEVIIGAHWAVHPDKGALFYVMPGGWHERPSPQCNRDLNVANIVIGRVYKDHEVVEIPMAYLAHADREKERLRQEKD